MNRMHPQHLHHVHPRPGMSSRMENVLVIGGLMAGVILGVIGFLVSQAYLR